MRDTVERNAGEHQIGHGSVLLVALVALMVPVLALAPVMVDGDERQGSGAIETPAGSRTGIAGQEVSAAEWHPAIEHGLGPIGPAPATSLGVRGDGRAAR